MIVRLNFASAQQSLSTKFQIMISTPQVSEPRTPEDDAPVNGTSSLDSGKTRTPTDEERITEQESQDGERGRNISPRRNISPEGRSGFSGQDGQTLTQVGSRRSIGLTYAKRNSIAEGYEVTPIIDGPTYYVAREGKKFQMELNKYCSFRQLNHLFT
jgi:hypothetical protein